MMWRASTSQGNRTPMPRSASAQSILPDDGDPNTSVTSGLQSNLGLLIGTTLSENFCVQVPTRTIEPR
jgi:hypothetical protein